MSETVVLMCAGWVYSQKWKLW